MKVTDKQIKEHRKTITDKFDAYIPTTVSQRIFRCIIGYGAIGLFPVLSTHYASALFMANLMVSLGVFVQLAAIVAVVFGIDFMKSIPADIRNMQLVMLGDQNLRLVNVVFGSMLVYALFTSGFPVFAVIIGLLSICLMVLNTKYYNACK